MKLASIDGSVSSLPTSGDTGDILELLAERVASILLQRNNHEAASLPSEIVLSTEEPQQVVVMKLGISSNDPYGGMLVGL